ncbi:hypothetical protein T08_14455 [Trichinella sp. T8]|nr:hypothetical protein T08_14455 [Trichinella sp. T8]
MPFLSGTSVVSLIIRQITLRQSSSVRIYSANVLVAVAFSAFPICVLRLLMKPVMLPTCVHLEFMAFPSRSTVPLLITNIDYDNERELCSVAAVKDFPTVRNCEDESCILNDRYRITIVESLLVDMMDIEQIRVDVLIVWLFTQSQSFTSLNCQRSVNVSPGKYKKTGLQAVGNISNFLGIA